MKKVLSSLLICLTIFSISLFTSSCTVAAKNSKSLKSQKPLFYYPVPFVPVLKDMTQIPDKSALLKTPSLVVGVLVYKGNYSAKSLFNFYKTQMKMLGWRKVGSFTSKLSFLAYKRPGGTVFISVSQGLLSTELRIVIILSRFY